MPRTTLKWVVTGLVTLLGPVGSAWCGEPANGDHRPCLFIVMAEREYHTDQTLPAFAKQNLNDQFRVRLLHANPEDGNDIPGLLSLADADILLLSVRRRVLPTKQMEQVRAYVAAGKPLVGVRTACHAFCLRNQRPPAGHDEWADFDRKVLGCFYHDHYGNALVATIQVAKDAAKNPILAGVTPSEFTACGSLYRCRPLSPSARLLMVGRVDNQMEPEPVAWTNVTPAGGRVFYTSLGHPGDFAIPEFVRLLRNGLFWAANVSIPTKPAKTITVKIRE